MTREYQRRSPIGPDTASAPARPRTYERAPFSSVGGKAVASTVVTAR
jgi:hypothetical protein